MTKSATIGNETETFSQYPHQWMDTDSFSAGAYRRAMVKKLLGKRVGRLLDVGCGPIFPNYAMADCADEVVALDWKPTVVGVPPPNGQSMAGDFIEADLDAASFDAIVAIDVLEHVLLENESEFAARCAALLKPKGLLVVSVPHRGTFAMMDPYEMRPRFHRLLSRLGAYSKTHNGTCDIRKGHKHYTQGELKQLFAQFEVVTVEQWGNFWMPVNAWAEVFWRKTRLRIGRNMLGGLCLSELKRNMGDKAYHIGICFQKKDSD